VPLYHVTSVCNRASIEAHGLDVERMGAARGIAGSRSPEQDGCFLAHDESTADFFVRINNTGGPVDVWEVDVEAEALVDDGGGFAYFPGTIEPSRLRLVRRDLPPVPW